MVGGERGMEKTSNVCLFFIVVLKMVGGDGSQFNEAIYQKKKKNFNEALLGK